MVKVIILHSSLQSEKFIAKKYESDFNNYDFWKDIEFISDVKRINLAEYAGLILIIATGGTEQIAKKIIQSVSYPILLIATPKLNSLAASLEIYSIFKHKKVQFMFWDNTEECWPKIEEFIHFSSILQSVNNAKIGIIGKPSFWLLSSETITDFDPFKTSLKSISIEKLLKEYKAKINTTERIELENFSKMFNELPADFTKEYALYKVLERVSKKSNLQALTIQCFELLPHNVTACLALALLPANGIIAGCEGDLEAIFTMYLIHLLTNKQPWMANPSRINIVENTILFAHCTVDQKLCEKIQLDSHMESGLSIGIRGTLKKDIVTILRISMNQKKAQIVKAKIIDADMNDRTLCRTQIQVKLLDQTVNQWMKDTLGNHQIVVYGDHVDLVKNFLSFCGFQG